MNTFKHFGLIVFLLSFANVIHAQEKLNIKFGKITLSDFNVIPPAIDSAANAVVIADWGNSEFVLDPNSLAFSLEFTKKTRIKIINKNGFNAADIRIYLYHATTSNSAEKLENLKAVTYNIEDGKKVVATKLENSSIFTEEKDKNWTVKKFTFPALKEGSIIEYSYTIKSDFLFNFQSWAFQGEYPRLWSEYNANIPEFFNYVILSQGYQPFFVNTKTSSTAQFNFTYREVGSGYNGLSTGPPSTISNQSISGLKDEHRWVMKNVPGLKEEPFTTTLNNHIAKIEFQLAQIRFPNSAPNFYMNDWGKVAQQMNENEKFGSLINRGNNWLKEYIPEIVGNANTALEKAKKIFEYVRNNISSKEDYGILATTNLKDVIKNKSGSAADINLLLIALLRYEDINANPVILSKRSHGMTNEIYPLMDRFDYVIAKANLDSSTVYLDASNPRIGFGKLPLECYNGHAREVTKETLLPVYFFADSLKENSFINSFISYDDSSKSLLGNTTVNLGYYSSLQLRDELANKNINEYKKRMKASMPENVEINNLEIDSLKNLDESVAISYDIKYKIPGEDETIYFDPLREYALKKNPFTVAHRFYPVEMPYTKNEVYTLNLEIPKGYIVDDLPKSTRVILNDNDGMFEYLVQKGETNIQMRVTLKINKANFSNDDYDTLRDFYSFVVKKEAEQIVFKKVK